MEAGAANNVEWLDSIRFEAERLVRGKVELSPDVIRDMAPQEVQLLFHELRVHQIELEMQNDELRRSREELNRVKAGYFDLYDLAPVGYCSLNESGLILQANLTAGSTLGNERGALVKQQFARFIVPEDMDRYYLMSRALHRGDTVQPIELRMVKHDGTQFWAQLAGNASKDDAGAIVLRLVLSDIDQRKRDEQVLVEREARFRGLVEQSLTGIYITQNGVFKYANPRLEQMLGYGSAELVGVRLDQLVLEQDLPIMQAQREHLRGDAALSSYEVRVHRRDGTVIDMGVQGSLYKLSDGQHATIGMAQDITEKRLAEADAKQYSAQLKAAFMGTVEVATTLSELRDPYTAGHERGVGQLASAIGTELGLDAQRVEGLRVAGYLHDIGKISIPAEILVRPGVLNEAEHHLVHGHALAGYEVLKNVSAPWPLAEVALQHHERMDGSGYPQGLKGDAILLESRIISVADVVEAMTSHRPYRAALGIDAAMAEIERGSATEYDPAVVQACLTLFREKGYVMLPAQIGLKS
jgi:PAS domain S-box-containing protein